MGVCSRSQAAVLVRAGRVTLNERVVRDPETPVHLGYDRIKVDDAPVAERQKVYLAMNKPRGVVTSASDEQGRATVYDLLTSVVTKAHRAAETPTAQGGPRTGTDWVSPVGRLDKASEGLLLFTNDSMWAARVTDPDSHLEKRYHVQVGCVADDELLAKIRRGITVDGERLRVRSVGVVRAGQKNSWLEIVLDEGKNRHIRRLLEALKVEVLRLIRVAVGPLELGDLRKGAVRSLTVEERESIDQALDGEGRVAQKHDRRVPRNVG
jgi:23S rRNA pseudouridine2605 synthase